MILDELGEAIGAIQRKGAENTTKNDWEHYYNALKKIFKY